MRKRSYSEQTQKHRQSKQLNALRLRLLLLPWTPTLPSLLTPHPNITSFSLRPSSLSPPPSSHLLLCSGFPCTSPPLMATGWVKSLHCKSNALEDVYPATPSKKPLLPLSCANSSHALKDVVSLFPKHPSFPPKKPSPKPAPPPRTKTNPRPKPKAPPPPPSPVAPGLAHSHQFPTLTELPTGHSSRRVVEIIFSSSWSPRGAAFPGEIEMLFRIHNPPRTVARFEEYRAAVRARCAAAHSDDARCAADGNEMMRFHCAPNSAAAGNAIYDGGVACCEVWSPGGKAEGVRTFAGSGRAHESGGGGAGRRAMLVCRVIAGRVRSGSDPESAGDSVSRGKGELVVFDTRAVLPCFLIIYRVRSNPGLALN